MSEIHATAIYDRWELNPDGKSPGIFMADPEGGDPICLAIFARVYHPGLLDQALAKRALLDRLEAAESSVAKWEAWFDRATADDDCDYLNGDGWSDATAIRKGFA